MALERLCSLDEAPAPGKGKACVLADRTAVALFRTANGFTALRDSCPHMDAPIHDGIVYRNVVTCRWHGWQFDLDTGVSLMSERICIQTYPVTIQDGVIWIETGSADRPSGLPQQEHS